MNKQQKAAQKRRKTKDAELQRKIAALQREKHASSALEQYHCQQASAYALSDSISIIGSTKARHLLHRMQQRYHAVRHRLAVKAIEKRIHRLELLTSSAVPKKRNLSAELARAQKQLLGPAKDGIPF